MLYTEQFFSSQDLTKITGINASTVRSRGNSGKIASNGDGYGLVSCLLYQIESLTKERDRALKKAESAKSKDRLYDLRCRELEEKIRALILANDKTEQGLIDRDDADRFLQDVVLRCRGKLLVIPSRLALELSAIDDPAVIKSVLSDTIYEALNELAREED